MLNAVGLRTRRPLLQHLKHIYLGGSAGAGYPFRSYTTVHPPTGVHFPHSQTVRQYCSLPPPSIPGALPRYMQPSHTLSKPLSSSFFPRTSPIPARLPTGFSPMGSATKSRCFWEVVILNRINLGIPRKSRLGLKTGNSQRLTGNLALKRS